MSFIIDLGQFPWHLITLITHKYINVALQFHDVWVVSFLPELLPELLCQLVHDGMTVVLNSLE